MTLTSAGQLWQKVGVFVPAFETAHHISLNTDGATRQRTRRLRKCAQEGDEKRPPLRWLSSAARNWLRFLARSHCAASLRNWGFGTASIPAIYQAIRTLFSARRRVFCDGDFWHGRDWLWMQRKLLLRHNAIYWIAKIGSNRERDRAVSRTLAKAGWQQGQRAFYTNWAS
jgi:hypothetical protein